jgi:F-type H+-transporting ATPase subunit b
MIAALFAAGGEGGGFESPKAWLPENAEIIYGTIASVIIFAALWKFAVPAMKKGLAERTARIQATMDKAAAARASAEADAAKARANLGNAEAESADIVAAARKQALTIESESAARVEAELVELRAKAVADIESLKARSVADVQGSVAQMAVGAAERVVESNLDADTQQALIEQFIAQVSTMKAGAHV